MGRRTAQAPFSLFSFQDIITSVTGIVVLMLLVMALELASRKLQAPAVQQSITREDTRAALSEAQTKIQELQRMLESSDWSELASRTPTEFAIEQEVLTRQIPLLKSDLAAAKRRVAELERQEKAAHDQWNARGKDRQQLERMEAEIGAIEAKLKKVQKSGTLVYRAGPRESRQPWIIECTAASISAAPLGPISKPLQFVGSDSLSRIRQVEAWAKGLSRSEVYLVLMVKPGGAETATILEEKLRDLGLGVGLDLIGSDQAAIDPEEGAPVVEEPAR